MGGGYSEIEGWHACALDYVFHLSTHSDDTLDHHGRLRRGAKSDMDKRHEQET
jgi:hypothetical protein